MTRASGTFEAKLTPQPKDDDADGAMLARLTIDKELRGDLAGTSKGQMLSAVSGTGELAGLTGSMAINIADGKHSYDFDDTLPGSL